MRLTAIKNRNSRRSCAINFSQMNYRAEIIFVIILLPFTAGILISYRYDFTKLNLLFLFLNISIFILLFIIRILYRSIKVYNHKHVAGILLNSFFFILGIQFCCYHKSPSAASYFTNVPGEYLRIKVISEPQIHNSILRFSAEVLQVAHLLSDKKNSVKNRIAANRRLIKKQNTIGCILIALRVDSLHPLQVSYGEVYIIPPQYKEIDPPYNPGEFDFQSWLANNNIHRQAFLRQHQMIPTGENQGSPVIRYSLALRQQEVAIYRRLIKSDEAFAVASTLLLGYRADLSAETLSAYARTGTIHALSVSGMHVGIIYLVLEWALQFMNRNTGRKIGKAILILMLVWFYTLLTGCSPSVLRSAIMLSAFILARSWNRNTNSYNILAFSAFCLLLYNPFWIFDAGFQLSYLSVAGLLYLQPKIQGLLYFRRKWLQQLWSLICLSLAAQIATFPFSIYYFHQFPVYFIFSNLFITLPITLLMYIGIVLLLFPCGWIAVIFERLIIFTNRGLDFLSHLPYSTVSGIWINKTEVLLLCLFTICLVTGLHRKNKPMFLSSVLIFLALQVHLAYDKMSLAHQRKIILFSLNKNYAAAFISSDTAVVVTDLMASDKLFSFSIRPSLDKLKINQLTILNWGNDTTIHGLTMQGPQLCFQQFNVLRIDTLFSKYTLDGRPSFDVIWLHRTPKVTIPRLQGEIAFKGLWIDATNNSYAIRKFRQGALALNIKPVVLKKEKATIIDLKFYNLQRRR